jgi:alpha-D-xyloside xylohydrolase
MKFTHGIWFDREHTHIHNAVEVAEVTEPRPGQLKALCTTRHVAQRGDTLNRPTITLSIEAAGPDVIACSAVHFRGSKKTEPRFQLSRGSRDKYAGSEMVRDATTKLLTVSSGGLCAVLDENPRAFRIAFESVATGKALADVGYASLQYVIAPASQGVPNPLEASTNIADPYYRAPASRSHRPFMSVSLGLQAG